MKDIRKQAEDMEFVRKNISAIQIKGQQHLLGKTKKLMIDYPSTIGRPIIEDALKYGGKITVKVICLPTEKVKPYLTNSRTIIVNH